MAEDLDKLAWEILRTALDSVEFPQYVTVNKHEDGSFSFLLYLSSNTSGVGFFYYKPSIELIKSILKDEDGEKARIFGKAFSQEISESIAAATAYVWLKNFHLDLAESFVDLPKIPLLTMSTSMQETLEECEERQGKAKSDCERNAHEEVKKYIAKKAQSIKTRVYAERENYRQNVTPSKLLIAFFYSRLYPKWKEAKDCYEKNKKYSNWRKIVAVAFEEDKLPSDLIERFDETSPNFDLYAAMPSTVALEHAARMCDVDVESVGLRTLQNYLKESREWIERVGEEKAEEEVGKRIARALENITRVFRVAYKMGTEPPIDKLSFFERQILADGFEEDLMNAVKKFEDECANSENERETYLH